MIKLIDSLVAYCVDLEYVTLNQASWLRYALEKRITSIAVSIPFLLLGIVISSFPTAISFYIGFCVLRRRINGIHAKTIMGCLIASLVCEFIVLGVILPLSNQYEIVFLLLLSEIAIICLGPYNHPNMHMSTKELYACEKGAEIRLIVLLLLIAVAYEKGLNQVADGLSLGVATAGATLAAAYINKKER